MIRLLVAVFGAGATLFATAAFGQARISAGQTKSGAMTSGDKRMDNGTHFDLWTYSGTRGERIVVTVRSIQLDAYVMVQRFPGGYSPVLARDDDDGGGSDARVELTLPDNDDYVIAVTTTERGETGAYRLSVESNRGTDSRLEITLPFTGEYAIRANSLSPWRPTGDYILRIDSLR